MATQRLDTIANQLNAPCKEVVICAAYRTPITKAKRGAFKDTPPEALISLCMKGLVERVGVDPKIIEDVAIGNCLQPGAGAATSRIAQLIAGIPNTTTLQAINRQCSSGLTAVANIANAIRAG
jgi:acetyl-CoA acyltransferase 1